MGALRLAIGLVAQQFRWWPVLERVLGLRSSPMLKAAATTLRWSVTAGSKELLVGQLARRQRCLNTPRNSFRNLKRFLGRSLGMSLRRAASLFPYSDRANTTRVMCA